MFKSTARTGNHHHMSYHNYGKWIPNFPPNVVSVFDKFPYHIIQLILLPSFSSHKSIDGKGKVIPLTGRGGP
jgi:hypothetical protein